MVLVPAGYFQMGYANGEPNEQPEHPVLLDAFYLDRLEVSNSDYHACVEAGACSAPRRQGSATHAQYRDDPAYDQYPVLAVSWDQAAAYCAWAGQRLPTEAEWEYAASGPDHHLWPWGDQFDSSRLANALADVQPVGSFPTGASGFGLLDMAGNVSEWVADKYDFTFYTASGPYNPIADGGIRRIYRGGSFAAQSPAAFTTSRRYVDKHDYYDATIGFRCAADVAGDARQPSAKLVAEFCQVYSAYKPGAACP